MQNILFFGDSLTAGYGLANPATESYPALIGQKISAAKLDYGVINAGLSGDTSGGGLRRLDYWISRPIAVFVLELGINDILRGIPPKVTVKNLQEIVDRVKGKYPNVKLALMGMQVPAPSPSRFAVEFNAMYRSLAEKNNMAFVPFFLGGVAGVAHLNLPDRLHPNAEGYQIIANKVWPVLSNLIA